MLAPDRERQELEKALRQHERRVERINDEIRELKNERGVHTTLLSLGGDEKLLGLLDRLRGDEDMAREALEGRGSFFEQHGVELPAGLQRVTGASTNDGIELRGVFCDDAGRDYEVVWNSRTGFDVDHPAVRDKASLNPDVVYKAERTQTSTDFWIIGTGFSGNGYVDLSIFMEPGRTVPWSQLGRTTADGNGYFKYFRRVPYLGGHDPQTRSPAFVGRDVTVDKPGLEEVPSYYWWPRL
ncbi:hypothetical protein [Streptomyces sp. NPDC015130]|uniref:hypothetical protein n=1 Tax=Streptomyces sp. NPDC015130 TaxID=3364940 RepID=UPI0036F77B68